MSTHEIEAIGVILTAAMSGCVFVMQLIANNNVLRIEGKIKDWCYRIFVQKRPENGD